MKLKVAIFFVIGILVGMGLLQLYTTLSVVNPAPKPILSLDQMYQKGIEDTMTANSNEICSNLTSIVESNGNLSWQGEPGNRSILVVVFTKFASSYPVGETVNTTWGETWVTVAPEIQTYFQNHADSTTNVTLRTLQLLGLPPNNANTYFVEMWVNPQSLFRPTPDNEINDTTSQLAFPTSATTDYKVWFNGNIIYSYFPERYPWTRLGYTYDWGNADSPFGLSEFVLKQNSTAIVKSVMSIEEYLSADGR